jgi:flagellar basal body-associated protein FliL
LISQRVGTHPNQKKVVLIGVIAAVVLFALVIGLSALMAHWSGESEKKAGDQAAPPATTVRRGEPGEMFKDVPPEK